MSVHRVIRTAGTLHRRATAQKRYRCDGHLYPERHYIEPGDLYIRSALPPDHPDIGNIGWWTHRFCMDCCPIEFATAS